MPALGENLKIQTILPLALASLVSGCGGQMSSNEAGLLDAVAFIIGGQQEGAIPKDLKPTGGAPFTDERSSINQSGHMSASVKPMTSIATAATSESASLSPHRQSACSRRS